jgi:hypothetical protein
MSQQRAVQLTADLTQRRADLIRIFGEKKYAEYTAVARPMIEKAMRVAADSNPLNAAILVCRKIKEDNLGEDVSTAQQFVLAAAADMAEER